MESSDHDILIEIRADLKNLSVKVDDFIDEQKCCNRDFNAEITTLKVKGSPAAEDALSKCLKIDERLQKVEKNITGEDAVEEWWKSKITITAVIIAGIIGVLAFFIDLWSLFT